MSEPKIVHLEDRAAFDAYCREFLNTDEQRLDMLAAVKRSQHPMAEGAYIRLAEAYFLEYGHYPKLRLVN